MHLGSVSLSALVPFGQHIPNRSMDEPPRVLDPVGPVVCEHALQHPPLRIGVQPGAPQGVHGLGAAWQGREGLYNCVRHL